MAAWNSIPPKSEKDGEKLLYAGKLLKIFDSLIWLCPKHITHKNLNLFLLCDEFLVVSFWSILVEKIQKLHPVQKCEMSSVQSVQTKANSI